MAQAAAKAQEKVRREALALVEKAGADPQAEALAGMTDQLYMLHQHMGVYLSKEESTSVLRAYGQVYARLTKRSVQTREIGALMRDMARALDRTRALAGMSPVGSAVVWARPIDPNSPARKLALLSRPGSRTAEYRIMKGRLYRKDDNGHFKQVVLGGKLYRVDDSGLHVFNNNSWELVQPAKLLNLMEFYGTLEVDIDGKKFVLKGNEWELKKEEGRGVGAAPAPLSGTSIENPPVGRLARLGLRLQSWLSSLRVYPFSAAASKVNAKAWNSKTQKLFEDIFSGKERRQLVSIMQPTPLDEWWALNGASADLIRRHLGLIAADRMFPSDDREEEIRVLLGRAFRGGFANAAVGADAVAEGAGSLASGALAKAYGGGMAHGAGALAYGRMATAMGADALALGEGARAEGADAIAIGDNARNSHGDKLAIGKNALPGQILISIDEALRLYGRRLSREVKDQIKLRVERHPDYMKWKAAQPIGLRAWLRSLRINFLSPAAVKGNNKAVNSDAQELFEKILSGEEKRPLVSVMQPVSLDEWWALNGSSADLIRWYLGLIAADQEVPRARREETIRELLEDAAQEGFAKAANGAQAVAEGAGSLANGGGAMAYEGGMADGADAL
ncbi:MAG: hypothetical protein PHF00_12425, partial [Elusimicrobia bacterium]|nr:hypothetical protein [Elusimicrobiota bacterium]